MTQQFQNILIFVSRLILASVLSLAVLGKIVESTQFLEFLKTVFGLSLLAAEGVLFLVVVSEAVLAGAIIAYADSRVVYLLTSILFLIFAGVLLIALLKGYDASCGCFGRIIISDGASISSIVRNVVLCTLAFVIYRSDYSKIHHNHLSKDSFDPV